ncbi:hypothetical protein CEUSTIGMA_g6157.t1 [Chlamydomonas eustigma]|uniref:MPN domain-containing protein n=1 Tax=Chlamydomonas eustigma TaxID=1157962 RepID=A0A250X726_9CHLO|nr:hypothetical protein CEUSTIGMA_g6157.t1 [Chlamydomonas eustigma]|eukprot:GAX78719.1 hypothetical protein CEUSTIGMA_g6157.t1 [Chlamydomonas eustigma]
MQQACQHDRTAIINHHKPDHVISTQINTEASFPSYGYRGHPEGPPTSCSACSNERKQVLKLDLPAGASDAEVGDLLNWFKKCCVMSNNFWPDGDSGAHLSFPTTLDKYQRARLHKQAQGLGLWSESEGTGLDRHLKIMPSKEKKQQISDAINGSQDAIITCSNVNLASSTSQRQVKRNFVRPVLPDNLVQGPAGSGIHAHHNAQHDLAAQLWGWCCQEGGRYESYSKREVKAMVDSGSDLPSDLQDLMKKRASGQYFIHLIKEGMEVEAIAQLKAKPEVAWCRDDLDPLGNYPVHLAAVHSMLDLLQDLVKLPGVRDARNFKYQPPLEVARKAGKQSAVTILSTSKSQSPERVMSVSQSESSGPLSLQTRSSGCKSWIRRGRDGILSSIVAHIQKNDNSVVLSEEQKLSKTLLSTGIYCYRLTLHSMVLACTVDPLSLLKILLHAAKYPHLSVNGVLLGTVSNSKVSVTDVIPMFHNSLQLAAPTEIALTQIDAYAEQPNNPKIVGYYHADAKFQAAELSPLAKRFGDKIADKYPGSAIILLDNKRLASFLERTNPASVLPIDVYSRDGKGSNWKKEQQQQLSVSSGDAGCEAVRQSFYTLFEQQGYRKLADFDEHLDDLSRDYLNPCLAHMVKLALPGQMR